MWPTGHAPTAASSRKASDVTAIAWEEARRDKVQDGKGAGKRGRACLVSDAGKKADAGASEVGKAPPVQAVVAAAHCGQGPSSVPPWQERCPSRRELTQRNRCGRWGRGRQEKGCGGAGGRVRMQRAGLRSSLPRALGSQRSGASGPPRTGQRVPKAPQWEQQLCPSSILTVSGPLVRPPGKLQSGRGGTARAQRTQLQGLTDTGQQHSQEVNFDSGFQTRGF